MEQTQAIQQLRQEIRAKQNQLEALEIAVMKQELSDTTRGIECIKIFRQGMGTFYGTLFNDDYPGVVEQALSLKLEVRNPDSGNHVVVLLDMALTQTDDPVYQTRLSIENAQRGQYLYNDCEWLYKGQNPRATHVNENDSDEEPWELEELYNDCDQAFDISSHLVKDCMEFLSEKSKVLGFKC